MSGVCFLTFIPPCQTHASLDDASSPPPQCCHAGAHCCFLAQQASSSWGGTTGGRVPERSWMRTHLDDEPELVDVRLAREQRRARRQLHQHAACEASTSAWELYTQPWKCRRHTCCNSRTALQRCHCETATMSPRLCRKHRPESWFMHSDDEHPAASLGSRDRFWLLESAAKMLHPAEGSNRVFYQRSLAFNKAHTDRPDVDAGSVGDVAHQQLRGAVPAGRHVVRVPRACARQRPRCAYTLQALVYSPLHMLSYLRTWTSRAHPAQDWVKSSQ